MARRCQADPGAGGCCSCTQGTAAGAAFTAAKQGQLEGLAVQDALGLGRLQTGKPAPKGPLHWSSARAQPCPAAGQRW